MNTVSFSMTMVMSDGEGNKKVLFDISQRLGYKRPATFYQLKDLLISACETAEDIIISEEVKKPCG